MDKPFKTVRQIFDEASELSDKASSERFVAEACAGDDSLRRRVEELLQAHDAAGGFMQGPLDGRKKSDPGTTTESIGPYRLIEKLGEGE